MISVSGSITSIIVWQSPWNWSIQTSDISAVGWLKKVFNSCKIKKNTQVKEWKLWRVVILRNVDFCFLCSQTVDHTNKNLWYFLFFSISLYLSMDHWFLWWFLLWAKNSINECSVQRLCFKYWWFFLVDFYVWSL